jgi:hypothetical protein
MEDVFKPRIGNWCLYETSNDNSIAVLDFATSKNPVSKRTVPSLKHSEIHLTSPSRKICNQTEQI